MDCVRDIYTARACPRMKVSRVEELATDDSAVAAFGVEYARRQCDGLLQAGVPGLHIYALNKSKVVGQIVKNLGLA
jgi:methylenetetrahydrofolate reductase (NADPH)